MTARSKVRNAMKATVGALMKMETHSCIRRQDLTAPIVIGVSFYFGFSDYVDDYVVGLVHSLLP